MDGQHFDRFTRSLVTSATRRRLAAALAAGVGSGLLRRTAVAAACKQAGKPCGNGKKCCQGATCRNQRCRCRAGLTSCTGVCVNLRTDPNRCGTCQNSRCPGANDVCLNGACATGGCTGVTGGCLQGCVCHDRVRNGTLTGQRACVRVPSGATPRRRAAGATPTVASGRAASRPAAAAVVSATSVSDPAPEVGPRQGGQTPPCRSWVIVPARSPWND